MKKRFDRKAEDLGNIVGFEHINLMVPDHRTATLFFIMGLGFTRDPYLNTGVRNMWVNIGRNQYHLPVGEAQRLRGRVGVVVPDLAAVAQSLGMVKDLLKDTSFAFTVRNSRIDVTCPWGNEMQLFAPNREKYGPMQLGFAFIEFDVPPGTAEGIARFYADVLGAITTVEAPANGKANGAKKGKKALKAAHVNVGHHQVMIFRESDGAIPDYDGHHIQVYVANFSPPHKKMQKLGMALEESNQFQYRFYDIVDPKNGKKLYSLEHEIRSMTHPLFARPLVNRNPASNNNEFAGGYETRSWSLPWSA